MTVEELIDDLRAMPPTARIVVAIRYNLSYNLSYDGTLDARYEFRAVDPVTVVYDQGTVLIQLDE